MFQQEKHISAKTPGYWYRRLSTMDKPGNHN